MLAGHLATAPLVVLSNEREGVVKVAWGLIPYVAVSAADTKFGVGHVHAH